MVPLLNESLPVYTSKVTCYQLAQFVLLKDRHKRGRWMGLRGAVSVAASLVVCRMTWVGFRMTWFGCGLELAGPFL